MKEFYIHKFVHALLPLVEPKNHTYIYRYGSISLFVHALPNHFDILKTHKYMYT